MRSEVQQRSARPVIGALAGALGGLAGSWAMVQFNHAIAPDEPASDSADDSHPHRRTNARPNDTDGTFSDEPASMQVASAVAEPALGRPLTEREKEMGGPVVHYLFGAVAGAIYGAAAEVKPETTKGAGIPFGASVWLVADEVGIPLAGLSSKPTDYPLSRHAAAFATHLVFGLTVECVRRTLMGAPRTGRVTATLRP